MKRITFFLIFLLSIGLVSAATAELSKTDWSRADDVTLAADLSCEGWGVVRISNANTPPDLVDVFNGIGDWQLNYKLGADVSDGKYGLSFSCADGEKVDLEFCVDSNDCLGDAPPADPGVQAGAPAAGGSSSGGSSGGGGNRGRYQLECDQYWSVCGADLNQSRQCFNPGTRKYETQTQACEPCLEQWRCGEWNECSAGVQTRECVDDGACNTAETKPEDEQVCDGVPSFVQGNQQATRGFTDRSGNQFVSNTERDEIGGAILAQKEGADYVLWASILGGVLLIVLLIFLMYHFFHKEKKFDAGELHAWVVQSRAAGVSDEDIREQLKENTGWSDEDIAKVL